MIGKQYNFFKFPKLIHNLIQQSIKQQNDNDNSDDDHHHHHDSNAIQFFFSSAVFSRLQL
jgi:hypothetical protein